MEFGDGTYKVGVDLQAGTYRLREPARACYWERLSGLGGTTAEIIAFDNVIGYSVVTLAPGDKRFTSQGCGTWSSDLAAVTVRPNEFGEGTFIVDVDFEPGSYRADGGNQCYWQRLSGFGGTIEEVIDGDVPSGPAAATIADGDRGFRSYGCGFWVRE